MFTCSIESFKTSDNEREATPFLSVLTRFNLRVLPSAFTRNSWNMANFAERFILQLTDLQVRPNPTCQACCCFVAPVQCESLTAMTITKMIILWRRALLRQLLLSAAKEMNARSLTGNISLSRRRKIKVCGKTTTTAAAATSFSSRVHSTINLQVHCCFGENFSGSETFSLVCRFSLFERILREPVFGLLQCVRSGWTQWICDILIFSFFLVCFVCFLFVIISVIEEQNLINFLEIYYLRSFEKNHFKYFEKYIWYSNQDNCAIFFSQIQICDSKLLKCWVRKFMYLLKSWKIFF